MATVRLTEKTLAQMVPPPGGARVVVRDEEIPGFIVVVGARARTFMVDYRAGGARRKVAIGRHGVIMPDGREPWSVARARQRARELLGQVAAGKDPGAPLKRAGGPTLREGLDLHLDNMRRRKNAASSVVTYRSEVTRHLADWLDRSIADLTAAELNAVHRGIRERAAKAAADRGAAPASSGNEPGAALANRVVRHVGAIWNTLDRMHELSGRNPARGVVQTQLGPRRSRVDDTDFPAWYAAVQAIPNPVRRDLYMVALLAGIRSDGVRHLRWEDLDEATGVVLVTHAKGGKPYSVPLGPKTLELLAARRADNVTRFEKHGGDHGWVFPSFTRAKDPAAPGGARRRVAPMATARERESGKAISKNETRRRDRAIAPVHDLRRTYNSVAIEIGIPPESRNMLMNHERRGVNVKHYGFPQNWDRLAECQRQIEAAIFDRLTRPTP